MGGVFGAVILLNANTIPLQGICFLAVRVLQMGVRQGLNYVLT